MGNICYRNKEEGHKHGAWRDAETEDENCSLASSSGDNDDDNYDAKAPDREQLILLHVSSRRLSTKKDGEAISNDWGEIVMHRNGTTRVKRPSISSTPMDIKDSFLFKAPSFPKSSETTEFLLEALGKNFLFDSISGEIKLQFVRAMQPQVYDEGEWVMHQGDVGDYFYIVEEGEVAFHVSTSEKTPSVIRDTPFLSPQVGTGLKGSTFGELALLYNTPRAASVRALTPLKLYKIDQLTFRSLLMSSQVQDRSNILSLVQKLSVFQDLDEAQVRKLADAFTIVEFKQGERIVNKGDCGNIMYIVKSGKVKVGDIGHGRSRFQDHMLGVGDCFGERALITGETRAANVTSVQPSTLLAISKEVLEEIIGPLEQAVRLSYFSRVLSSIPLFEYLERYEIDRCVKFMKEESFAKGDKISNTKGKLYLIEEGNALMTIQRVGNNKDTKKSDNRKIRSEPMLIKFEKGDYFGDLWCSYKESIEASQIVAAINNIMDENTVNVEADMKCLVLLTSDVERVIGDMDRLSQSFNPRRSRQKHEMIANKRRSTINIMSKEEIQSISNRRRSRVSIIKGMQSNSSHFDRIKLKKRTSIRGLSSLSRLDKHRILGVGTFGKVWMVTYKSNTSGTPTPYALKVVSKRQLLKQRLTAAVLREKNVLESIEHPFLLHMVSSFQDNNYLYFVMGLIQGGELFELMYPDGKKEIKANPEWKQSAFYKSFGEEDERPIHDLPGVGVRKAMFYSANIIEALAYLHSRRIVYRDLKPENVMLNEKGYCVIVDMGFAKVVLDKTYTLCGTLEYLAPEVAVNKGHNHVSDYWSFGCLLYELLVGKTPFFRARQSQLSLLKKIVTAQYTFPGKVDKLTADDSNNCNKALSNWKDLISGLLKPKTVERHGNLQNGVDDILDHDWFACVDFNKLRNQSLPAPWVPTIVDQFETSHRGSGFGGLEKPEVFRCKLSAKDQEAFEGF